MNEYHKIPHIDSNLLVRIGVLIIDIKKDLPMPIDMEQLDYLKFEFVRIGIVTLGTWTANEVGLSYFLQFHQAEGKRLLKEINKEIRALSYTLQDQELKAFKKQLYRLIRDGLKETLNTLNSLETGEGIHISIP